MRKLTLGAALWLLTSFANAQEVIGQVISISDGDTFTLLTALKQQVKVRLAEIDTPEKDQPYGTKSRQILAELAFQKTATLQVQERDRYGRSVARVFVDGKDINREMVSHGAAWVYRQYSKDKSLLALEDQARKAKRGLWALPEAERMPPWEWRQAARDQRQEKRNAAAAPVIEKRPASVAASSSGSAYNCSTQKTCGQMSSCAEAEFHLNECGNSRLDRDNDGIPCETICH